MLGVGPHGPRGRDEAPDAGGAARDPARGAADAGAVDAAERDAWVVLSEAPGVGPATFARLVATFGTAAAVLRASASPRGIHVLVAASTAGAEGGWPALSIDTARAIAEAAQAPDRSLEPVRRAGLAVLVVPSAAYPSRLRRIELPPPVLYVRGSIVALDPDRAIAIVGTRRPTEIGRATAGRIADAVASAGATIVSGLAFGIDAAAHAAAVAAGVPTVAVIGGGHERLYPAAHRGLVRQIVDGGGAVISEFAPETVPSRGTFPRRNRIISGLADATVVVEAGARSGALTTAAWALEQGRGLHIVPGRLDDPAVAGCLAFLREAGPEARIVAGVPELIEDLGLLETPARGVGTAGDRSGAAVLAGLPPVERSIARAVIAGASSVDELVAVTSLGGATVLSALTALEMRGAVVEAFGRYRTAGRLAGAGPSRTLDRARARGEASGHDDRRVA